MIYNNILYILWFYYEALLEGGRQKTGVNVKATPKKEQALNTGALRF